MLPKRVPTLRLPSWAAPTLGSLALAIGLVIASETKASAFTSLPYSFGSGTSSTSFTTSLGNSGLLSGNFTLPCNGSPACVLEPLGSTNSQGTFRTLSSISVSYSLYQGLNAPSGTLLEAITFQTGIYGYNTSVSSYYLFFKYDVAGNSNDRNLLIWLSGPLPIGGSIPIVNSVQDGGPSFICKNPLPDTAANECAKGSGVQENIIFDPNSNVTSLVPSPFSITLLIPAAALVKLRRRYQPKG